MLVVNTKILSDTLPDLFLQLTSCAGSRPPQYAPPPVTLTFDPFHLESGVRITCDVGYLYANFSLPRPLCSRLRPDVRDRQTSVRRQTASSLNTPPMGRGHNEDFSKTKQQLSLHEINITHDIFSLSRARHHHNSV